MPDKLVVAVSGLGPLQPGRAVVRALREAFPDELRFVALSYGTMDPGAYEDALFERTYLMPYPRLGGEHFFDRLRKVKEDGGLDVLFPTFDTELPVVARLAPRLADLGVRVVLPTEEALAIRSKARLPELAEKTGVRIPTTRVAHSWDAVWHAASDLGYPLMVKGQFCNAYAAASGHQLEAMATTIASEWGWPLVLQSIVEGVEFDCIALGDGEGGLLGAVPMKKLQLDDKNKAWGGITVDAPDLVAMAADIVEGLKWRGVLEIEVIRDAQDRLHLIEINPRVPSWAWLAVAAGQNVIAAALRQVMGWPVEKFEHYRVGAMHLRQCFDVVCSLDVYESLTMTGQADHRNLQGSLRSPAEGREKVK